MTPGQFREELDNIEAILGNSIAYSSDPEIWDTVSRLITVCREIVVKLPEEAP